MNKSILIVSFHTDEYLPKPEIPRKELRWEDDLELRSKFLERRVSQQTSHHSPSILYIF